MFGHRANETEDNFYIVDIGPATDVYEKKNEENNYYKERTKSNRVFFHPLRNIAFLISDFEQKMRHHTSEASLSHARAELKKVLDLISPNEPEFEEIIKMRERLS